MRTLHHLALGACDVSRVATFYRTVFGLPQLKDHHDSLGELRSVWLKLGDAVLMIERVAQPRSSSDDQGHGPFLLAFSMKEDERDQVEARLLKQGIALEQRIEKTTYFRDPEGNRVALSCYVL